MSSLVPIVESAGGSLGKRIGQKRTVHKVEQDNGCSTGSGGREHRTLGRFCVRKDRSRGKGIAHRSQVTSWLSEIIERGGRGFVDERIWC